MFEVDIKHDGWKTKDRQMEQPGFFSWIIMVNYFSSLTSIWGYQGNLTGWHWQSEFKQINPLFFYSY